MTHDKLAAKYGEDVAKVLDAMERERDDVFIVMARQLRLAVVTNVYNQGLITEEQAKDILAGNLTPGDDSTYYDDSGLLSEPDGLERIENDTIQAR